MTVPGERAPVELGRAEVLSLGPRRSHPVLRGLISECQRAAGNCTIRDWMSAWSMRDSSSRWTPT